MEQARLLAKQFIISLVALSIVLLWASNASAVSTWNPPTASAPSGNTDTPLNAGSVGQIKTGGLTLNTGGAAYGLIVQSGKTGLNTSSPAGTLDVNGTICISGDCISSWGSTTLVQNNFCYGSKTWRDSSPSCANGYYLKAIIKDTNDNWDGYGGICCLSSGSSDSRMTSDVKSYLVNNANVVSSSIGLTYNQVVDLCKSNRRAFGDNTVDCPAYDPL
jgi:hypothetical protein